MKRELTHDDVIDAVIGGTILGGGGGGSIQPGLRAARVAVELGSPQLWTTDEFSREDLATTVAIVGAPAAPMHVTARHHVRALELLVEHLGAARPLAAIHTNENGAETTVNGWIHSALTGLPVIDLACNGRAHPLGVMGSMGLHDEVDYVSVQAFAGGDAEHYVEGRASGHLFGTAALVRRASQDAGGGVAVVRNPTTVGYAIDHGAPGAISQAIELGRCHREGGLHAVAEHLGGRVAATGTVVDYRCEQQGGLDVGKVALDDPAQTTMHFVNEYMTLDIEGERTANFPDLIMTFDEDGTPLPSAAVAPGMRISVLLAPAANLTLSQTMFASRLYEPLEAALGLRFAPAAETATA